MIVSNYLLRMYNKFTMEVILALEDLLRCRVGKEESCTKLQPLSSQPSVRRLTQT